MWVDLGAGWRTVVNPGIGSRYSLASDGSSAKLIAADAKMMRPDTRIPDLAVCDPNMTLLLLE